MLHSPVRTNASKSTVSTLRKIPASFYENKFHVVRVHVRVLSERENTDLCNARRIIKKFLVLLCRMRLSEMKAPVIDRSMRKILDVAQ